MEANAPGNVPGLQEAEARFYVEEMLQGRFPATKPQIPAEVLAVFTALAATRGTEGARAGFVLGNYAGSIVATVHEPRDVISRGAAVQSRATTLLNLYAKHVLLPGARDQNRFHPQGEVVRALEAMAAASTAIEAMGYAGIVMRRAAFPAPVLHGRALLEEAMPHLRLVVSPQAVEARAGSLYGAFCALCPAIPLGVQLEVLLQWCDPGGNTPYQGVGAETTSSVFLPFADTRAR